MRSQRDLSSSVGCAVCLRCQRKARGTSATLSEPQFPSPMGGAHSVHSGSDAGNDGADDPRDDDGSSLMTSCERLTPRTPRFHDLKVRAKDALHAC